MYFKNIQLVHVIPRGWKSNIKQTNSKTDILTVKKLHIIMKSRIITTDKLLSRELYSFFITNVQY